MYSPTTRVLTVLELLQTHGKLSGPELANRLGVDGRTGQLVRELPLPGRELRVGVDYTWR